MSLPGDQNQLPSPIPVASTAAPVAAIPVSETTPKSNKGCWIIGGVLVFVGLLALGCIGGIFLLMTQNLRAGESELVDLLNTNDVVTGEVGTVTSVRVLIKETRKRNDSETRVYEVSGELGTIKMVINWHYGMDDRIQIVWIRFIDEMGYERTTPL